MCEFTDISEAAIIFLAIVAYAYCAYSLRIKYCRIKEALIHVGEEARARQKSAKRGSLGVINDRFEQISNAALARQLINQRFLDINSKVVIL